MKLRLGHSKNTGIGPFPDDPGAVAERAAPADRPAPGFAHGALRDAAHNLEWPQSSVGTFVPCRALVAQVLENQKEEMCDGARLEVNFALWIMIGCAISEVVQFAGHLN
jgi:hypothetical protein